MRHYYALSDSFTGDNPKEYTHGFANRDKVIAFRSKKERDEWLKTTKLRKAKPLTRAEAMRIAPQPIDGIRCVAIACVDDEYMILL